MRKAVWYIIVVAITLITLIIFWQFSLSIVLFALSLAVSAALKPLINYLAEKIKSRQIALGGVYLTVIGLVLVLSVTGGQLLLQDLQRATDDFVVGYNRIKADWPNENSVFRKTVSEQLPTSNDLFQALLSEEGMITLSKNREASQEFFSSFGYIAVIFALSIYWSSDRLRLERISVSLFPDEHRARSLHIWRAVENGVGSYLRSEIIQSALAGLILGVGYRLIGIQYPALLALWGAIVRLIPWFGILIAITPLFFLSSTLSFSTVLTVLFTIAVLLILKKVIESKFLNQHRNNPLLMAMFVIILAEAFGVIGVLLAPPLAVAVQILLKELYPFFPQRYSDELREAFELKKRLTLVEKRIKNSESPEAAGALSQLHWLLKQTISYIQRY